MDTLLLDQATWDWVLDANGNIAVASDPYAQAQDVASACKLFAGELWYDTSQGIPYFQRVLGQQPSLQYLKSQLEKQALTVPGIVTAQCLFATFDKRVLTGQVRVTNTVGNTTDVNF